MRLQVRCAGVWGKLFACSHYVGIITTEGSRFPSNMANLQQQDTFRLLT